MNLTNNYKDLPDFLAKHSIKKDNPDKLEFTHTRMPGNVKGTTIYPASFYIPEEDKKTFYELYYDHIFNKKKMEYLTEKQLIEDGPLLVDLDFRYDYEIECRQHDLDKITDILNIYLEQLKQFFTFDESKSFMVYVMEKPNINKLHEDKLVKDGIHICFGLQMNHIMQEMLREKVVHSITNDFDIGLPLTNSWEKVIDDGISKGCTNWTLYGSRKPGHEAYELTYMFKISYDSTDGEFAMEELDIKNFDLKKDFIKLTAQYKENVKYDINPRIIDDYNKRAGSAKSPKLKKNTSKTKIVLLQDEDDDNNGISLEEITNAELLKKAVDNIMNNLTINEYYIKETHDFTQILPEKYYEPGSHLLNRQVAFALKNTDERLFLSWVMLRSKASDFDYSSIPELFNTWKKYFNKNNKDGLTKATIMYYAKQDAYDEFMKIKKSTVDYYVEQTLNSAGANEFDIATVLYHMFKDKYVCCSITNKEWFTFRNHRWVQDKGLSLRLAISKDLFNIYFEKNDQVMCEKQQYDASDERQEYLNKKIQKISNISDKLKRTNDKNNIMREAMELFYDRDFIKNMDTNVYLMCFTNGVVDFKNKVFRDGYPQDYITKTTGIPYIPYNENNEEQMKEVELILDFMDKVFPDKELNRYMWDHAASCLIGINLDQTFNIYRGNGSNGKSKFTDLMTVAFGEYKGTVPITLVTEKRNAIGGTSSEVYKLKGVRYAVMQEPTKNSCRLNEGVMKELTGGDPIQARELFRESETFVPQFKLVVCTNILFDMDSTEDGTWRRIRLVDFMSKFVNDVTSPDYKDEKHLFPKDKHLDDKIKTWGPMFMSMLVKRAFETNGVVNDCDLVLSASDKYRQGQDHIAGFISEMIVKTDDPNAKPIGKKGLMEEFKLWFTNNHGTRKIPKGCELYDFMDKKFGKCKPKGWTGIAFVSHDDTNEIEELEEE